MIRPEVGPAENTAVYMSRKVFLAGAYLFDLWIALLFFRPMEKARSHDFMQFYFAGKLVATGQIGKLYHAPAYEPLAAAAMRAQGERLSPFRSYRSSRAAISPCCCRDLIPIRAKTSFRWFLFRWPIWRSWPGRRC